eukprot:TRINITY_DN2488_c0_g1_i2.p1 TRINITY_DN2488_c0_g1~~TRINITY_DN2488_c0_g1_i2.p1  ORF type:complete len:215 (+),score=47.43 TRINITY_DN2488_c0_g1_i2:103-747(+)
MAAARNGKIFVGGLPHTCNAEKLIRALLIHGPIREGWMQLDDRGKPKGYGFIYYVDPDDADKALNERASNILDDKLLIIRRCSDFDYARHRRTAMPMVPAPGTKPLHSGTKASQQASDWREGRMAQLAKLGIGGSDEGVSQRRKFSEVGSTPAPAAAPAPTAPEAAPAAAAAAAVQEEAPAPRRRFSDGASASAAQPGGDPPPEKKRRRWDSAT